MALQRAMAVKVIQENNAFGKEGEQRKKFKLRTEKGLEKNNLEMRMEKERRKTGEKNCETGGGRHRVLTERGEKRRNAGNVKQRDIFIMNVRVTLTNKREIKNSRTFRGESN